MFLIDAIAEQPAAPTRSAVTDEPRALTLGDTLRAQRAGAQVLDTRSCAEFADGHLAGSVHIALDRGFAESADAVLSAERPVVLVAAPGREREAAERLRRVGFDRVIGHLSGGLEAIRRLLALVRHPARISSALLRRRLAQGPLTLIDVRTEAEWRREAITGSVNIPLRHLRERIAEVPAGPVVVYCRTGELSSTAASLFEQAGRMNVVVLAGGLAGWQTG
jgi:rhodanese-related sulfurtransferase